MAEPRNAEGDEVFNLESITQEELGRSLVNFDDELEPEEEAVPAPLGCHRCDSEHRELLRNHFPVD